MSHDYRYKEKRLTNKKKKEEEKRRYLQSVQRLLCRNVNERVFLLHRRASLRKFFEWASFTGLERCPGTGASHSNRWIESWRTERKGKKGRERESYRGRILLSVGGHNILVKNGWPVLLAENNARCRAVLMAGEQQSCPCRI